MSEEDLCMVRRPAILIPPFSPVWCVQMGEIVVNTLRTNGTHRRPDGNECPHEHLPVLIAVPRRGMYPGMTEYAPAGSGPNPSCFCNQPSDETRVHRAHACVQWVEVRPTDNGPQQPARQQPNDAGG